MPPWAKETALQSGPVLAVTELSAQQAAPALGDSSCWLATTLRVRRRSSLTSLMMSRRTAGLCSANLRHYRVGGDGDDYHENDQPDEGSSGSKRQMTAAIDLSSFAMLAPASSTRVHLECPCAGIGHQRPALWAGLGDGFGL